MYMHVFIYIIYIIVIIIIIYILPSLFEPFVFPVVQHFTLCWKVLDI